MGGPVRCPALYRLYRRVVALLGEEAQRDGTFREAGAVRSVRAAAGFGSEVWDHDAEASVAIASDRGEAACKVAGGAGERAERRRQGRVIDRPFGKWAPPAGFRSLQPRFTVTGTSTGGEFLPVAHTCSHEIELPEYGSKEALVEKVRMAIQSTSRFDIA